MESWISDLGLQRSVADSRIAIAPQYSLSFAKEHQKPYFGRQLSAFQSPPVRYALLADLVRYVLRGKSSVRILEVGSWAGASAITFATVIRELGISDGKIVCIDQWGKYFVAQDKSLHYKCMDAAIAQGEIQKLFRHNITACGVGDMVEIKQARSCEALPELESGSYDLVYLDGSHKKDDVLCDLQQAKRLVRSGGVICGDDLELLKSQLDSGAHQVELDRGTDYVVDPKTGISYHPGVTEAIAVMFDGVWQERGLWCVKRSGGQWSIPDLRPGNLEIPTHLQHAVEIPYGIYNGYEMFQLGEGFVAYPMVSPHWFQDRIVCGAIDELVMLLDAIEYVDQARFTRIVESRSGFNIVSSKGKIWIIAQSVGGVDFHNQEQLKRLASTGQVLEVQTLGEARAAIGRMSMDEVSNPHIVESRDGFNIVRFNEKNWLVDQSVGRVDFRNQEQLGSLVAAGSIFEAESVGKAREMRDRLREAKGHIAGPQD